MAKVRHAWLELGMIDNRSLLSFKTRLKLALLDIHGQALSYSFENFVP